MQDITITAAPMPDTAMCIEAPGLDRITAYLFDIGPGQGRVILECYGECLTGYWAAMGNAKVADFVRLCDVDYLAGKMIPGSATRRIGYMRRIVAAFHAAIKSLQEP